MGNVKFHICSYLLWPSNSGKSWPRALQQISGSSTNWREIDCWLLSSLRIYNEQIRDLLVSPEEPRYKLEVANRRRWNHWKVWLLWMTQLHTVFLHTWSTVEDSTRSNLVGKKGCNLSLLQTHNIVQRSVSKMISDSFQKPTGNPEKLRFLIFFGFGGNPTAHRY